MKHFEHKAVEYIKHVLFQRSNIIKVLINKQNIEFMLKLSDLSLRSHRACRTYNS